MTGTWILILILNLNDEVTVTEIRDFRTHESCSIAAQALRDKIERIRKDSAITCVHQETWDRR